MIKPMLAKKFEDFRDSLLFPLFIQPKLDGVRMTWQDRSVVSRSGKDSISLPSLVEQELWDSFKDQPLDGEIYSEDSHFDSISGEARRKDKRGNLNLKFVVYDIPVLGVSQVGRINILNELFWTENVKMLKTYTVHSLSAIEEYLEKFISLGYEGAILRNFKGYYREGRSKDLLKYKRWIFAEVLISGIVPGKGKHIGKLGAFYVRNVCKGWECKVGTGFSDLEREEFWGAGMIGKKIRIKYQNLTQKGVPRFPVFEELLPEGDKNG